MLKLPAKITNRSYLIETDNYEKTKKVLIDYAISIGFNKENLLSGNSVDFKLIERDDIIKVDEIREKIVDDIYLTPRFEDNKIYVLYDSSKLNQSAQNALLKTLEEVPENVIIFLVATNIKQLLDTIKSRCIINYDRDEKVDISKYKNLKYYDEYVKAWCDIKYGSSNDFIDLLNAIDEEKEQKNLFLTYLDLLNIFLHDIISYKKTLNKKLMYLTDKIDILITTASAIDIEFWWEFISDVNKYKLLPNNNLDYKMILINLYLKEKQKLDIVRS